jgi:hypothetical protein
MNAILFLPNYFRWHYTKGVKDLINNLFFAIHFIADFFSIPILFKTLFSPWERMGEGYRSGFHPKEIMSSFLINSIMRAFGFFVRAGVLIIGFLSLVLGMILGLIVLIIWLVYPIILPFILAISLRFIFS